MTAVAYVFCQGHHGTIKVHYKSDIQEFRPVELRPGQSMSMDLNKWYRVERIEEEEEEETK